MDTLHRMLAARFGRAKLAQLLDVCLEEPVLHGLAEECDEQGTEGDREWLVDRLAQVASDKEEACATVARALVRANYDLIKEVASSAGRSECTEAALRAKGDYHPAQVEFAMLAGKPAEVGDMRDNVYEGGPGAEKLAELADERPEEENIGSLVEAYRHLAEELEEARAEREEILDRLDRVLEVLEESGTTGADIREPVRYERAEAQRGTRVALFVDVQSVFYNARNLYGRKMDFKKLVEVTRADRELGLAVAYIVQSPDVDQSNFISMLQHNGYSVRQKTPGRHADGVPSVESSMAADIASQVRGFDAVVLVAGDGEIMDLAGDLSGSGVRVELFAFEQNVPDEARGASDQFVAIDEELLLGQEYSPRSSEREADSRGPRREFGSRSRGQGRGGDGRSRWESRGAGSSWRSADV